MLSNTNIKINMKIAIFCRPQNASPKVLALSFTSMLTLLDIEYKIFDIDFLARIRNVFKSSSRYDSYKSRLLEVFRNISDDKQILKELSSYDLIVVSESCPLAFYKDYYDIEKLKKYVKSPLALLEVYYLKNTPYQLDLLVQKKHPTADRYDWHFAVSDITEIKGAPSNQDRWSRVGLRLKEANLTYNTKKDLIALIDFPQAGNEKFREQQIQALKKNNINYIELCNDGIYSIDDIRSFYSQCSIYFIQKIEAFGLPIAELLASGAQVFCANKDWPMSWRMGVDADDKNSPGEYLPDIFTIYDSSDDLERELRSFKENWNSVSTPQKIFDEFIRNYPHFYYGDMPSLALALEHITNRKENIIEQISL